MNARQIVNSVWVLVLCGCFISKAHGQSGDFTVQVAAVPAREEAQLIVNGLTQSGLKAYLTRTEIAGRGVYYRVRVGRFPNSRNAQGYGRQLKTSGLVADYAIFKYEPPVGSAPAPKNSARPAAPAAPPQPTPAPSNASRTLQAERARLIAENMAGGGAAPPIAPATPAVTRAATPTPTLLPAPPARYASTPAAAPNIVPAANTAPATKGTAAPPKRARLINAKDEEASANLLFEELEPLVLQGQVETVAGEVKLVLYNKDRHRSFSGTLKMTLAEGGKEADGGVVPVSLQPGEERPFDLAAKLTRSGSYWMAVYDARGALQLLRSAALTKKSGTEVAAVPKPSAPVAPTNVPVDYNNAEEDKGHYINPPDQPHEAAGGKPTGEIKIIPRQLAATAENLTIEFEIIAPGPLGYISLTMQTANATEKREAIMTTSQGRVPFLVPGTDREGGFSYELKDEQGKVLAQGRRTFRELAAQGEQE